MPLRRVGLTFFITMIVASAIAQNQTNVQAGQGTLPVMFDSVRAMVKDDQVQIGWSNLTEREVSYYLVERSKDGKDFKPVYKLDPSSNLNEKAAYLFTDPNPLGGNSYYRISVVIINGRVVNSRILKAQTGFSTPGFTVYPNPVTDERINVSLAAVHKGKYVLQLTNAAGIHIQQTSLNLQGDGITQLVDLPVGLKAGLYVLSIKGETYFASHLVIKK